MSNPAHIAFTDCQKALDAFAANESGIGIGRRVRGNVSRLVLACVEALCNALAKHDGKHDDIDDAIRGTREWTYAMLQRLEIGEPTKRFHAPDYPRHDPILEGAGKPMRVTPGLVRPIHDHERPLTNGELTHAIEEAQQRLTGFGALADKGTVDANRDHLIALLGEQRRRATLGS